MPSHSNTRPKKLHGREDVRGLTGPSCGEFATPHGPVPASTVTSYSQEPFYGGAGWRPPQGSGYQQSGVPPSPSTYTPSYRGGGGAGGGAAGYDYDEHEPSSVGSSYYDPSPYGGGAPEYHYLSSSNQSQRASQPRQSRNRSQSHSQRDPTAAAPLPPRASNIQTQHAQAHSRSHSFSSTTNPRLNLHTQDSSYAHSPRHPPGAEDLWSPGRPGRRSFTREHSDRDRESVKEKSRQKSGEYYPTTASARLASEIVPAPTPPVFEVENFSKRRASRRATRNSGTSVKSPLYEDYVSYTGDSAFEDVIPPPAPAPPSRPESVDPDELKRRDKEKKREAREARAKEAREKLAKEEKERQRAEKKQRRRQERENSFASETSDPYSYQPQSATHFSPYGESAYGSFPPPDPYQTGSHGSTHGFPAPGYSYIPGPTPPQSFAPAYAPTPPPPSLTPSPNPLPREGSRVDSPKPGKVRKGSGSAEGLPRPRRGDSKGEEDYYGSVKGSDYETGGRSRKSRPSKLATEAERYEGGRFSPRPQFKRRGSAAPSERDLDRKDLLEIESRRGTPKLKAIEAPPPPRRHKRRDSKSYHEERDDGEISESSTAPISIPGGESRRTRRSKTLPSLDTGRGGYDSSGSVRRNSLRILDKPGRRYSSNSSRPSSVAGKYPKSPKSPEELTEESTSEESESVSHSDSEDDDGTVLGTQEAIKPSQISVKKGSGRSSRKEARGSPLAITWGGEDIEEKERRDQEEDEGRRRPRRRTSKKKKHQLSVETRADDDDEAPVEEEKEKSKRKRRPRKPKEKSPEPINESAITEESEAVDDSQAVVSDTTEDKKEDSDSEQSIQVLSASEAASPPKFKSKKSLPVPERSASASPNPAALLNIPTSVSRPPSSHGSRRRRRSRKSRSPSPTSLSHSEASVKAEEQSSESEEASNGASEAEDEVRRNSSALPIAIPGSAPRSRASTPARSPIRNKGTPLLRASTPVNIPRLPTPTGSLKLAGAPRRPAKRSPISNISRALSPLVAAAAVTALAGTEIETALEQSRDIATASEGSDKEEKAKAAEKESSGSEEESEKEEDKSAAAAPAPEEPEEATEAKAEVATEEEKESSSEGSSSDDEAQYHSASEVEQEGDVKSATGEAEDEESAPTDTLPPPVAGPAAIEVLPKSESESGSEESSSGEEEEDEESDKETAAAAKPVKIDPLAFGSDNEEESEGSDSGSDESSGSESETPSTASKNAKAMPQVDKGKIVKERPGSSSNSVTSGTSSSMKRRDLGSSVTDPTSPTASSLRRGSVPEIIARRGSDAHRDDELVSPTTSTRDPEGDFVMTDEMSDKINDKTFESKAELIAAQLSGSAKDDFEDVVRRHRRDIEALRAACDDAIKERDKLSKKLDKVDRAYERKDNDLKDAKKAYEDLTRRVHDLRDQHDVDVKRAIQVRDKDWDKTWTEKNKHLIRDLEAARSQRHSLEKIIAEKEDLVQDLEEQISRLKHDISMSTRTEAQKTDDLFSQELGDLWRNLQQWVFLNFKGKINFDGLPDDTKAALSEVTNGNPHLILSKRYFVISAVISKALIENVFNAYMYGMTKETNETLATLEQYLASLSDAPNYDAAINRWRAQTLSMIKKHAMPTLGSASLSTVSNPSTTEAYLSTSIEDLLIKLGSLLTPLGLSNAADPKEKLRAIIEIAAGIAIDLRVQRARFAVSPVELLGEDFEPETMDDLEGHEDEDCGGKKVACVAWPAVWKSGDENGENTHLKNLIYKAQVFLVD